MNLRDLHHLYQLKSKTVVFSDIRMLYRCGVQLMMLTATGSTATIMALNTRQGFNSNSNGPMAPRADAANRVGPVQGKQQTSGYIHALFRLICWLSMWDILNSASLFIFIYIFFTHLFICLEFFIPLENFSLIWRSLIHTWS